MNKELLEKLFDKCYRKLYDEKNGRFYDCHNDVKQFIFETVIPEVLKNITPCNSEGMPDGIIGRYIKTKAKENFGIDL